MNLFKVLPLKGYKSLRALNAFNALMLGLKMLPAYMNTPYEEFYKGLDKLGEEEKISLLLEAAKFVELQEDEVKALVQFCCDRNGVPFDDSNLKNLQPDDLLRVIVSVCMEISRIKIDIIGETEKKKLKTSPSMSEGSL